jgi:hypothetical protein
MSEGSYIPPPPPSAPVPPQLPPSALPPPPPPPPAPPSAPAGFDFVRSFAFIFEDPRWVTKILIGGLFYIASMFLIGVFFVLGYCARLARNVVAGVEHPLPEWDDLGEYFGEGLRLFGVICVFIIPLIMLALIFMIPAMMADGLDNDVLRNVGGGLAGCLWCLLVPIGVAVSLLMPAALMRVALEQRFNAAFEVREIWQFVKANIGNYLLAFVVALVARFLGGLGIFLLCIGIFFTLFWALVVSTHAYAQVWRFARRP